MTSSLVSGSVVLPEIATAVAGLAEEALEHRLHDVVGLHALGQISGATGLRELPEPLGVAEIQRRRRVGIARAQESEQGVVGVRRGGGVG